MPPRQGLPGGRGGVAAETPLYDQRLEQTRGPRPTTLSSRDGESETRRSMQLRDRVVDVLLQQHVLGAMLATELRSVLERFARCRQFTAQLS